MHFETFDLISPNQCEMDPTTTYAIENFSNNPLSSFAVVPLDLTKDDLRDLNHLHVENTCQPIHRNHDFPMCATTLSHESEPEYYQSPSYRDVVEKYFKGYKSFKSEPELMSNLVALIVRLTNQVAKIIPGTLISPILLTYHAETEMNWHIDNYHHRSAKTHKFLATLKGDHTLYCTGSYNASSLKKECVSDNTETAVFSASFGFGTIHKTGKQYGAIHSVPPINEQRFVFTAEIVKP